MMALRDRLAARPEMQTQPAEWEATTENIALCRVALRAEAVPHALLSFPEARRCIVRGIRHHEAFAKSADVAELCAQPGNADIARARHARLIMSNQRPVMEHEETYPYCVWHPDVATRETYRWLAEEYPALSYNAGRACAVAGYAELYRELDLLPDVAIAEEARDNQSNGGPAGCGDIFTEIVDSPVRFAIMDDYTRPVNLDSPRSGAFLNGDTQVLSLLDVDSRQPADPWGIATFANAGPFWDIAEDGGVTGDLTDRLPAPLRPDEVRWLHTPLPPDLPTPNKDLLILMAAYDGNIDRYARLRRPFFIRAEHACVIRGIYHSAAFARWWLAELDAALSPAAAPDSTSLRRGRDIRTNQRSLKQAIIARAIMSNDITLATASATSDADLPYLIWFPQRPRAATLAELARRRPAMAQAAAHACIVADYQAEYDALAAVAPTPLLRAAARSSPNPHYAADLEKRAVGTGGSLTRSVPWLEGTTRRDAEPSSLRLCGAIGEDAVQVTYEDGIYDGVQASASLVDLFLFSPEELRQRAAASEGGWYYLYEDDPT